MALDNPMSKSYTRTQEYSGKIRLPKLDLLHAQFYLLGTKQEDRIISADRDFEDGEFGNSSFLQQLDWRLCVLKAGIEGWKYEMRRGAQEILPFLYLGPAMCMKNWDFLRKENFSLLLSVRSSLVAGMSLVSGEKAAHELGIESESVDIVDDDQALVSVLPSIIRRINDHVSAQHGSPRKVLLFCESGNERSAVVAAAYLMAMFNVSAADALHAVQQRRLCVNLGIFMLNMLLSFESILTAKRDVVRTRRAMIVNSSNFASAGPRLTIHSTAKKRSRDDLDDDDETMETTLRIDEGIDRRSLAPFEDREV